MSLVDPSAIISDTLSLESAVLQRDVWRVLQAHIRSSCCTCNILKVLAHETVPTSWVGGVANLHLFLAVTRGVASLVAEEQIFFSFVTINVF